MLSYLMCLDNLFSYFVSQKLILNIKAPLFFSIFKLYMQYIVKDIVLTILFYVQHFL